jgi:hypothetical protein
MSLEVNVRRVIAAVGEGIRTFGARRECETSVCHHAEESYPCKAEQRNNSCEEVSRFWVGKHGVMHEPNAHALSFRNKR